MGSIQQVFLLTADLEQSRTFYEEALGLAPETTGETSVAYETGGCELKLQADFEPGVLGEFNLDSPPATDRGAGAIHVLAVHGDLEDRYETAGGVAARTDGRVLTEPRDVPWGERMFLIADPDGYVWEIRAA